MMSFLFTIYLSVIWREQSSSHSTELIKNISAFHELNSCSNSITKDISKAILLKNTYTIITLWEIIGFFFMTKCEKIGTNWNYLQLSLNYFGRALFVTKSCCQNGIFTYNNSIKIINAEIRLKICLIKYKCINLMKK